MRIGLLSWILDRERTGVASYLYSIVEEMIKESKNNQISLIHYEKNNDELYSKVNNVIIPSLHSGSTLPLGLLTKAIKDSEIDVFHLPSHWPVHIAPFFCNPSVKKVLTVHDIIPILFNNLPFVYRFWGPTLKLIKNRADCVIVDSENTKVDCMKYLKIPEERIKVIYLAADEKFRVIKNKTTIKDELKLRYNVQYPFILYVGNVEVRKNVSALIKSFYKLKKRGIAHKLVLIGARTFGYKKIYELVLELGLSNEVIFTGYVSNEDLVKFYNTADLFVFPSLYEGFRLPPLEAMVSSCPIITSNTSSLPEVVGDAGVMVDPQDFDLLANEIYHLLTNDNLRQELGRKGLERSKMFSWEKTARETWKVYEDVWNGGND